MRMILKPVYAIVALLGGMIMQCGAAAPVVDSTLIPNEYDGASSISVLENNGQTWFLGAVDDTLYYSNLSSGVGLPFANIYLYSNAASPLVGGGTGVLDGADDFIFEMNYGQASAYVRRFDNITNPLYLTLTGTTVGDVTFFDDAGSNIHAAINGNTGVVELSLPKTLLNSDNYTNLRWGAQAWGYELSTFSSVVVNEIIGVPEPSAFLMGLAALPLLALRRRRK